MAAFVVATLVRDAGATIYRGSVIFVSGALPGNQFANG
jgi:hypothetical protein